jgi:DME family drug/metabolite transporter
MLLGTIVLWALNLTVTKYILTHGMAPLAYATVRYGAAAALFVVLVLVAERGFGVARRDLGWVVLAAVAICVNQYVFVYAVEETTASTVGLILGSTPVFAALVGLALGLERPSRRFWVGAAASFVGVGFVAVGGGGDLSGNLRGDLFAVATAATWALYSVAVAPLMERYSPSRISAIVLPLGWLGMVLGGFEQTVEQDYSLGSTVWLLFVFATLGPLVLTNVLWFRALHQIGPSRATLAANLQPFIAAVFAVVLLSESLGPLQLAGGAFIAVGILMARSRRTAPAPGAE